MLDSIATPYDLVVIVGNTGVLPAHRRSPKDTIYHRCESSYPEQAMRERGPAASSRNGLHLARGSS
jgi:hypothetical protein